VPCAELPLIRPKTRHPNPSLPSMTCNHRSQAFPLSAHHADSPPLRPCHRSTHPSTIPSPDGPGAGGWISGLGRRIGLSGLPPWGLSLLLPPLLPLLPLLLLLLGAQAGVRAGERAGEQMIARWDFNQTNDLLRATSGAATLSVLGGLRVAAASGTGSSDPATVPDFALQLSGFPKQGTAARSAGLEVVASTVGFESVVLRFDLRPTGTASRRLQVLYSVDGVSLLEGPAFVIAAGGVFTNGLAVDLSGVPGAVGNPSLRLRLVSDWDGDGYAGVAGAYGTTGTWRIDHLRLAGSASGDPANPVGPAEATDPIVLTSQPRSLEVPEGGGALFRVAALGRGPLTYQWCLDGRPLPGANRQELRIAQVYQEHLGLYTVRIHDGADSVLSDEASLSLLTDPTILPTRVQAEPGPGGSIRLSWNTRPGGIATLLRSQRWDGAPVEIGRGLTGGSLEDRPPVGGPYFYWVELR